VGVSKCAKWMCIWDSNGIFVYSSPCGGKLQYLQRSPASSRWQKENPVPWGITGPLSLGGINTGTWSCKLGVGCKITLLHKRITVENPKWKQDAIWQNLPRIWVKKGCFDNDDYLYIHKVHCHLGLPQFYNNLNWKGFSNQTTHHFNGSIHIYT
jgi:hypothetical protein